MAAITEEPDVNDCGNDDSGNEGAEFSDRRLKRDLRVIQNALHKVSMLHGYTYSRLSEGKGRRSVGVVAQEVAEVLPEAVYRDGPSGMQKVAYGNLVALLIEAVKELAVGGCDASESGGERERRRCPSPPRFLAFRPPTAAASSSSRQQYEMLPRSIPAEVFVNGEIVGIDANGYLTKEYARAVSFAIKKTGERGRFGRREKSRRRHRRDDHRRRPDDSYSSDSAASWSEPSTRLREVEDGHHRDTTDSISIYGRTPVKLPDGVVPARGDYIVAVLAADMRGISGQPCAPADMTFAKRANAVGRVMTFLPDGRPSLRILF